MVSGKQTWLAFTQPNLKKLGEQKKPIQHLAWPITLSSSRWGPSPPRLLQVPAPALASAAPLLAVRTCAKGWAPVDGHLCLVGQPLVEKLQEDPLGPPAGGTGRCQHRYAGGKSWLGSASVCAASHPVGHLRFSLAPAPHQLPHPMTPTACMLLLAPLLPTAAAAPAACATVCYLLCCLCLPLTCSTLGRRWTPPSPSHS